MGWWNWPTRWMLLYIFGGLTDSKYCPFMKPQLIAGIYSIPYFIYIKSMMTKVPVTRPNAATVIAALYSTWAGAWCPQGLKLHSNLKVFSFLILPPPTDRTISGSTCKQGRCKHGPLMAAWLAMSRFVSVGYTPQTTDICVCCQHVDNVGPIGRQHSVKLAYFIADKIVSGNRIPDTIFYM